LGAPFDAQLNLGRITFLRFYLASSEDPSVQSAQESSMRLSCRFLAFFLAVSSSLSVRADASGPVIAKLRVKGEKQRAEVFVDGSFAVPV
jgi:hypothetical protein